MACKRLGTPPALRSNPNNRKAPLQRQMREATIPCNLKKIMEVVS